MAALGIDGGILVAQLVNFFLLLALLSIVLYKPMTKMLRDRSERIARGLADAAEAERRRAQAEADYQKRLEEARREAQAILAQAREAAEKERGAIIASAQAEANALRERAREDIERAQREAEVALRQQMADLAIDAAGQVLGQAVDMPAHRRLVQDFMSHLERAS